MLIKIARSLYRERERGGDKKVKTLLISVVLYPEAAAAPPYAATTGRVSRDRGREAREGRKGKRNFRSIWSRGM